MVQDLSYDHRKPIKSLVRDPPEGVSAPLVVRREHEVAGQVVAALLASAVVAEKKSLKNLVVLKE